MKWFVFVEYWGLKSIRDLTYKKKDCIYESIIMRYGNIKMGFEIDSRSNDSFKLIFEDHGVNSRCFAWCVM